MIDWEKICDCISDEIKARFHLVRMSPISGGYTNQTWHLEGLIGSGNSAQRANYFVKLNSLKLSEIFSAERAGLAALAATSTVHVPEVITQGQSEQHSFLVLEYLELHSNGNSKLLGTQLAALHRVHSAKFGWDHDNSLGLTKQHNAWSLDWIDFWREQRIGFQLDLALHNGYAGKLQELGRSVMEAIPALLAEHQPAPSLLHGDLWGGNHAFLADGTPVIFDPATYYGDREADIAMTELFGGFDADFYAAYQAAYPLESGYAKRKTLYNLYHILNHCNMVSSSYISQAEGVMLCLLKRVR